MIKQFVIQFNTHSVSANIEEGLYRLFKYTDTRCELETFTSREEAEEYIITPFPDLEFLVSVHDDE